MRPDKCNFILPFVVIFELVTIKLINGMSQPNMGYPAGLLPNCPGMLNNTSISNDTMKKLQVVLFMETDNHFVERKSWPIMSAHKFIAKDKSLVSDLKAKKTILYVLGSYDTELSLHSRAIAMEYAKRGHYVFLLETYPFLDNYFAKALRLTKPVGSKIGEFLFKLYKIGLPAENLELLGFSVGAHIASHAAKRYYELTGKKPSRITGLDPAGPCYRSLPLEMKLNPSDAERVDVIHTNMDGFGIAEALGHVDFYVNGGEYQPNDEPYIPCLTLCSQMRAPVYWWQAIINPKKFIGLKCESIQDARFANCYNSTVTNYLGLETKFHRPGIYYLATDHVFPYYLGKEGLKAENEVYSVVSKIINEEDNLVI